MKNKNKALFLLSTVIALFAIFPTPSKAAQIKTLVGTVTRTAGSQIFFKTTSGANYAADLSAASLFRKYGATMQFAEILPSDKIQVTGKLWEDNSISATNVKNLSLYVHSTTFNAKISTLNPSDLSFVMQSKNYGSQLVHTNSLTIFKMNNSPSGLQYLEPGMNVIVKATWERDSSTVFATSVAAVVRLINIEFTGSLKGKDGTGLTVVGNGNVLYGVDASSAKIVSKNNKLLGVGELRLDDSLKISGKHRSEDTKIIATKIKDLSLTK